ncbi:hypothetical protein GCM10012275_63070 [Longimycelium tulufanense]|uniref:DUF2218 domain-containing protein n=1 Tax=Longimycelium tulufanense TaxID=907463 RepID=A0A8J3CKJ2_9PSEU|nr:DUF2218 domain-containing protein [Longimycelium tulufanense]GGM83851.1 hypothetical protein GCM10012275_63070 [Longimycelium tulufanense]
MPATTLISEARVETDRPGRYLVQLCKHLGHKVHAEWSEERGFVDFGAGNCLLRAEPGVLVMRATGTDEAALQRVEHVAGSHLERFGGRDELVVRWERVDA